MIKSNFLLRNRKILLTIGIFCVIGIVAVGYFYFGNHKSVMANQEMIEEYAIVSKGDIEVSVTGSGAIESSSVKNVAAEVSAKVKSVNIAVGDTVKKGDILFELDSSDLETQIRNKQKTFNNYQKTVNEYAEDISNLNVYANANGYVTNLKVEKGDNVNKNTVLFEVVDDSYYIFKANFHYNANNPIQVGDEVTMMVNDAFSYMNGTVSKVSDLKQHYEYGGEIQEVEIQVENPGYTLAGIIVSQITVTTQTNAKIMALNNSTFETVKSTAFKCPSSGTVASLNINEGDYITSGSLVIVLENEDLYENLVDAKTALADASTELADASTELADIREDYTFYTITAPIDGVVTSVSVNVDDYVRSESTLAKIVNNTEVQFQINVDELDILNIEIGQEVKVTIDALEETEKTPLIGYVTEIALEGTNMNSVTSYPVTISLAGSDKIRMGMNCSAEIVIQSAKDVLVIPVEAAKARRNQYFVTLEDGSQREIEIGIYDEDYIEIISGLTEGEKIKLPIKVTSTQTTQESKNNNGMGNFMGGSSMPMTGGMPGGNMNGGMNRNGGSMPGGK